MTDRIEPEQFWARVDLSGGPDACWPWLTGRSSAGYGQVTIHRRSVYAHRVAFELSVGPIPEGLELDHLCRNPACVNPAHLEPVTHAENVRRGDSPSALHARKTHCPQGHPYDEVNTYITPSGSRQCRTCRNDAQREARAALREYDAVGDEREPDS